MKYALYILGFGILLFGVFLYRRRKPKKIVKNYNIRSVLPEGGDPFDDRIEFFMRNRSNDR